MPDLKLSLIITTDGKAAVTGIRQIRQEAEGVGTSAHAGATQAGAAFDGLGSKVGALGRNLSALLGISFGAAIVKEGAAMVKAAVMSGDAYNTLQARIQDATRANGNYAATSQAVLEISQRTGAQLSTSVSLYQSLARSAGELGAKQADVLKLQETVQKLGVIGGAATANMNAGLLQFGQMLAGGVAHAEEMNSLLENIPAVAEAIARGMGMTTGQLRAAVLEGKVLSQDVMRAILSQAGDVDARFKAMPMSIERATTELNNAWSLFMGNVVKSSGLVDALSSGIQAVARDLEAWGKRLDPANTKIADIQTQIAALNKELESVTASSGNSSLLKRWWGRDPAEIVADIVSLQNQLADAQGSLTSATAASAALGASLGQDIPRGAQAAAIGLSDVMRSVQELNAELRIQLQMGDASRAHMQAYRSEAKLQAQIDKALSEGKADLAFSLEEERMGLMQVNAENIRLQGTLDATKETHKAATHHVRAHSAAKRELAKETRDYAREADRAIDFVERENQAIYDTSERLLKLAAEYGNGEAKAILYQRQLEEVTRALEAMGATAEEVKAAQQKLWEDMTKEGQAAVKIREANEKAAKDAADEWKRQSDEIERALTDSIMRGFEGGKSFAKNLVDTIKNMFNTLVLRPIIQAIVQPVAGAATSLLGGGGGASVGSMAGLVQNGSNLMGIGGSALVGSAASWLGTTAFGGTAFGGGMVAGLAGAGGGLMSAAGAFSAGASMMASGSVLAGLGTIVGAAIPVIGWVVAIASLLSSVLGGRGDQTPDLNLWGTQSTDVTTDWGYSGRDIHTGGGYESGLGRVRYTTQHNAFQNEDAALQFQQYMEGFGISEDMIAKTVGEQVSQTVNDALQAAGAYMKIEEPDDWTGDIGDFFQARFSLIFDTIGGDLDALFDQFMGEVDFADSQQVAQLTASIIAINTATGDFGTVLRSLADPLQTDFAAIKQLAAEGEILPATLVRLGAQLMSVNDMMDALGVNLLPLNQLGAEAANALIDLAGGMENLTNASSYFYEHFYTEEERRARIIEQGQAAAAAFSDKYKDLIAASGAAADGVIDTGAELRAFVESLDLTTEAGRAAYLAAMALAPSIVAVTDAMNAAGAAADSAAESTNRESSGGGLSSHWRRHGGDDPADVWNSHPGGGRRSGGDTTPQAPIGGETPGSSVPDIGGWQPWHDTGSAAAGTGGGTVADLSAQLADFMAGIRDGLDRLQLSDFDYSLRALGLEFDALRAKAEALGASAEDMALIDELEGLRESELRAAEAARLAADAARAAAGDLERVGALGSAMNDVQDQLAKLQLSDTDYALRELSINMAALRAQIIALGGSAEDLALVDQLEALRLAQIEAAAAAEAARQAEEAQAEAERQAREQAEAAYEALATAEKQAQQELDALADEMEEFNRAVQSVRDDIAGSVLSILRDQPGWSEADYQRQRINQLRQRIDQASGLEQIALIGELQEAILARYQAERAELEATATQQTDLYSAMEQAHQAELQHYQDVTVALRDLAKYVDSLKLNDQLSTLTPFQKLEEAQRQFYATLGLAQGGDAQAIRDLSGAASAYLQDARAYFASGEQYTVIFDAVTQALEALTGQNVAAPMGEDEWRDFMAGLQSTQTDAVVDLSGIQDQALAELQALDELLTILTGEQALAAQEQQAAILETLQEARDTFASFAGEMPEDLARAADDIGATTDAAADRITTAITGAIQSMDQHLADTNAQVSANTQAIAGLQAQLAALAAQNAALSAQNAALQAQLDSNTANLA